MTNCFQDIYWSIRLNRYLCQIKFIADDYKKKTKNSHWHWRLLKVMNMKGVQNSREIN